MAAPVFTGLDDNPAYTENSSSAVLDDDVTISDADVGASTPFTGATLTLIRTGGANSDDVFSALGTVLSDGQVIVPETIEDPDNPGNFIVVDIPIGNYTSADGTLVITFNDQATAARINMALQALTYANSSEAPPGSVTISYTFDNGEQATGSITVGITPSNDPPSIDVLNGAAFYTPGAAPVALSPGIVISDLDSPTLSGAKVTISQNFAAGDLLTADAGTTGIVVSFVGNELTLSGSATLEQYRAVLATVAYSSSDPAPGAAGPRDFVWQITDSSGAGSGQAGSALDFVPVVDLDQSGAGTGFATTFTEGGSQVAVADSDAVINLGSTGVTAVTVVLTNAKAGDTLAATAGGGLTVDVDNSVAGKITLTITGLAAPSTFEDALRSVTFSNASANVDPATRDITFTVTDANNTSPAAHALVTISAVNDPGSATDDSASTAGNTTLHVAAAQGVLANDSDPDGLTVITGNVATSQGGSIQFAADGSYTYTPAASFFGTDTVDYTAQDPFGSQVSATLSIAVGAQRGTSGDDSYTTAPGNTAIDAGGGIDTITFGFRLVDATVTYQGNSVIIDSASSHTVLTGFEKYVFSDGTVHNNDGNVLVDDLFYFSQYHDVWNAHLDAELHYNSVGWHEGRDPDAFFSTLIYLSANADVKAAGINPLDQFHASGWQEGRVPSLKFDPAAYLAANPDVAAAHIDPLAHFLQSGAGEGRQPSAPTALVTSGGFDYVYYLQHNPDVAAAHVDPLQHFQAVGWMEGRNPNALFDTAGYLATYGDVAAAHINPLDHYNAAGWHEGRDPSVNFDTTAYLATYKDVAAAQVNPLVHFLQFGQEEGRSAFADGVWG